MWRPPLARDERGVTVVEFGIVAPVLALLLVGGLDMAHSLYMQAALEGAVQKTARDSALESGVAPVTAAALDQKVADQVHQLSNQATFKATRRYYRTFSDAQAAKEETYTDTNGNHTCDGNEPYQDINNNGHWDRDGGDDGQGGAKDRTLYTVEISYPRLLPMATWLGFSPIVNMKATTVLENQPYAEQGKYAPPTWRNCTP
jgi:Flp pilus assembly protein TadG